MLFAFFFLLLCQLTGEAIVYLFRLPLPGAVVGMLILFGYLFIRGDVPPALEKTSNWILSLLALLFVPAGTGIMAHWDLLRQEWLPIVAVLILSTLLTLVFTAYSVRWIARLTSQEGRAGQ